MSTIPALVAATVDRFGERPAIVDGDTRLTYAELLDEARRFGAALVAAGVGPGDRVAIWAPNRAEWVVAVLGLWEAGAALVPINTRFKGAEAADILARSGARVLVTVTGFLGTDYVAMLRASGVDLPELRTIVVAGGPASGGAASGGAPDRTAADRAAPGGVAPDGVYRDGGASDGGASDGPPPGGAAPERATVEGRVPDGTTAEGTSADGQAPDGLSPDGATSWPDFLALATAEDLAELARRAVTVATDDVADILFTSGTTGVPKGVVQTHGRTLLVATDWVAMTGLTAGDRYLMVNPYFHMFGLKAGILASVAAGATMYPEPVFDADRVLARVAQERITVLPGPPTLYQSILDHPDRDRHDLSSLRVAVTGAADIPVELIRRVVEELPFPTIVSGYGLTEGGTAASTSPVDTIETIATTIGRARPGFEIRIVDDKGNEVPAGEAGEILLRGGSIMSHYLDDPGATAHALSDDGWLRTGDLGILDGAGYLRFVGRTKDMFIVGGFNAYPAEIENALRRHPDIAQAAVIGIPDERLGEVGMAFVVLRPGATTTGNDIVTWSRDQMANYKAPRAVEVVDALPLNATGKVEKQALRARVVPA